MVGRLRRRPRYVKNYYKAFGYGLYHQLNFGFTSVYVPDNFTLKLFEDAIKVFIDDKKIDDKIRTYGSIGVGLDPY